MKRVFSILLFGAVLVSASRLSAQTVSRYSDPHSTFHVSFFPPLSTNGRQAPEYTNVVSLNLLVGVSKNERALTLAGLGNVIRRDANGFQAAGLFNDIGNEGRGMLASGAVNIVRRYYTGAQFAGVANFTHRFNEGGAQFAGLFNLAGHFERGAQFAGAINVARDFDDSGAQFAGVANVVRDIDTGAQFSGAVNFARDIDTGAQFAGAVNIARDIDGLQAAGAVNIARDVRGAQIGVVNIARSNDTPIGLVNIIGDGEMSIGFGYNEIGTASVNFRSGGRALYGIVGAGWNHKERSDDDGALSFVGGLGAHINIARWVRINSELTFEHITGGHPMLEFEELAYGRGGDDDGEWEWEGAQKSSFALLPAFRLGPVEIFGGPSINYLDTHNPSALGLYTGSTLWEKNGVNSFRLQQLFIGWQAGVHFIIKGQRPGPHRRRWR